MSGWEGTHCLVGWGGVNHESGHGGIAEAVHQESRILMTSRRSAISSKSNTHWVAPRKVGTPVAAPSRNTRGTPIAPPSPVTLCRSCLCSTARTASTAVALAHPRHPQPVAASQASPIATSSTSALGTASALAGLYVLWVRVIDGRGDEESAGWALVGVEGPLPWHWPLRSWGLRSGQLSSDFPEQCLDVKPDLCTGFDEHDVLLLCLGLAFLQRDLRGTGRGIGCPESAPCDAKRERLWSLICRGH